MAKHWIRQGPKMTPLVRTDQRRMAHYATDKATTLAKKLTQGRIRSAGLGRLAGAVGSTSSLRKAGYTSTDNAWGAVFARGKAAGRGNQALLAYSEGASILPVRGKWLAFATDALPKRAGGFKMTPARYKAAGLEAKLGKLHFVLGKRGKSAVLVARKVVTSKKSGRILRQQGGRTSRAAQNRDSVVAFVLIRFTRRAARFNQGEIMRFAAGSIGNFAEEYSNVRIGGASFSFAGR